MIQTSVDKIAKLVEGFVGLAPTEDIQAILLELGAIKGYFAGLKTKQVERIHFPKTFSVNKERDFVKLQEKTPSHEIYCTNIQYDTIAETVAEMQSRRENFNRFTLLKEVQKVDSRVTMPAVLVCLHYWLSIDEPLLVKDMDLFKIDCDPEDFKVESAEAWNDVDFEPLIVEEH